MLRVTTLGKNGNGTVLRVEGRIVAAWAEVLEAQCRASLDRGEPLRLDLAGVSYVDGAGMAALRRLRDARVALDGCSPLLQELLAGEDGP